MAAIPLNWNAGRKVAFVSRAEQSGIWEWRFFVWCLFFIPGVKHGHVQFLVDLLYAVL